MGRDICPGMPSLSGGGQGRSCCSAFGESAPAHCGVKRSSLKLDASSRLAQALSNASRQGRQPSPSPPWSLGWAVHQCSICNLYLSKRPISNPRSCPPGLPRFIRIRNRIRTRHRFLRASRTCVPPLPTSCLFSAAVAEVLPNLASVQFRGAGPGARAWPTWEARCVQLAARAPALLSSPPLPYRTNTNLLLALALDQDRNRNLDHGIQQLIPLAISSRSSCCACRVQATHAPTSRRRPDHLPRMERRVAYLYR